MNNDAAGASPVDCQVRRLEAQQVSPTPHDWRDDGLDTHKGEYWYKCARCGRSDWIASYGTKDQLMPRECKTPNVMWTKRLVLQHAA